MSPFETVCDPQPHHKGERNFNPFASPQNNKSGEKNLKDTGDSGWRPSAKTRGLLHLTKPSKMRRLTELCKSVPRQKHNGSQ